MPSNKRGTLRKREEALRRALVSGADQETVARAAERVREAQLAILKKAESGVAPAEPGPGSRMNIERERKKWLDASVSELIRLGGILQVASPVSPATFADPMSWAEALDNKERLDAFFDRSDDLDRISLIEVTLDRQGPQLRMRANLFRFPDRRSPRWPVTANRAQITLCLWQVGAVSVQGWASTVDGRLTIRRLSPAQLEFSFHGSGVAIEGQCGRVKLDDLVAYVEGAG